jgi:hypothetical protein
MQYRLPAKIALLGVATAVAAACSGGMQSPASPSAVREANSALNADGSNLKASAPAAVSPLFEITNVSLTPTLAAVGSRGVNASGVAFSYRFQVAEDESFNTLIVNAMGTVDSANIARYTVETALQNNKRYVWRVRAELQDAFGPWSNLGAFTTVTSGGTVVGTPGPGPSGPAGPRAPDPPPGQRLPLPDMFYIVQQYSNTANSCPRGIQYVNNPWQDQVIDRLRTMDSRWGYNAKPTRTAAQNGGQPVVAAGDEAAYHYSAGPSQGSPEVHLVDMLIGHCGPNPTVGWRVFTGEEPGIWTGAGRF